MNNGDNIPLLPKDLSDSLTAEPTTSDALGMTGVHLENIAYHDFATYEYLFDPWAETAMVSPDLSDTEKTLISEYLQELYGEYGQAETQAAGIPALIYRIRDYATFFARLQFGPAREFVCDLLRDFVTEGLPALFEPYAALSSPLRHWFFEETIKPALQKWAYSCTPTTINGQSAYVCESFQPVDWVTLAEIARKLLLRGIVAGAASFIPFPPSSINVGLRIVYRQDWRTLGNQDGEVVRTIPLGPRQSEKISIKLVRRNKGTRQLETVTATERTSEASDTARDSSEIVEEASKTNQWEAEGEASVDVGVFKAGGGGGGSGESARSSKETKTQLSETVQKTAHKMRRETKVVVSTESELTFEETRASEITNPNDEVAVTFVYQKLQKQYEVYTYLAEVASVVFVAERVPPRDEVTADWVRHYDWIIGKVLLDDSFEEILQFISSNADIDLDTEGAESVDVAALSPVTLGATSSLAKIQELHGDIGTTYSSALGAYRTALAEDRQRRRELRSTHQRIERFLEHVRDNILHYCRAIWSEEDPEVRLIRYMQTYVPTDFIPFEQGIDPLSGEAYRIHVTWEPDLQKPMVVLSDIINPAGPVGFAGNYAIFHLKGGAYAAFREPLTYLKLRYAVPLELHVRRRGTDEPVATPATSTQSGNEETPRASVEGRITEDWLITYHPYVLTFLGDGNATALKYKVTKEPVDGPSEIVAQGTLISGQPIDLPDEGFTLKVEGTPRAGDTFDIIAPLPNLCDPELAILRETNPLPPTGAPEEQQLFSDKLIEDMLTMMPGLLESIEASRASATLQEAPGQSVTKVVWGSLGEEQKRQFRNAYHEFLLRREHTRRFVVDTNSLVLNLHTGSGSTLEPFKRAHRYLDVAKAAMDVKRRKELMDTAGNFGDPDVERVVVVQGSGVTGVPVVAAVSEPGRPA